MHEMSVAESLVALIEEEARAHGAARVRRVAVRLGALGHVEPSALAFCFESARRGSLAEGAALDLEIIPGQGWCERCGRAAPLAERYAPCPACGAHLRLVAGDELRLAAMEVE